MEKNFYVDFFFWIKSIQNKILIMFQCRLKTTGIVKFMYTVCMKNISVFANNASRLINQQSLYLYTLLHKSQCTTTLKGGPVTTSYGSSVSVQSRNLKPQLLNEIIKPQLLKEIIKPQILKEIIKPQILNEIIVVTHKEVLIYLLNCYNMSFTPL
jgi:hypothetical protein